MAFSTGNTSTTLEELLQITSEAEIVSRYLGVNKIPCLILSPLRRDTKPSLGLYSRDGVRVYWKDFATKEGGSIYDLLEKLWNCSFAEVIKRIVNNYNHERKFGERIGVTKYRTPKIMTSVNKELKCKVREWRQYDIDYWASYGVPLVWLQYAEVYPISHKIIVEGSKNFVLGADKYAYAFIERKEGKVTMKIYQPFNKSGYKWSNKHDKSVISLWTKLPESGEKLVICSSLKDALCLWANTGVPAVAVQGEGFGISNTALGEMKRRFKKVIILFDNDKTGIEDSKKLSEKLNLPNVVLPQFNGGKDISDLYKCQGKEQFMRIMSNLLNINY